MKLEELIALGISEETAKQVLGLHGKGIEKVNAKVERAEQERDGYKTQLDAANTEIKGYKDMDIDTIKKNAAKWEETATNATKEANDKIAKFEYDRDLTDALRGAKIKDTPNNLKAVTALLNHEQIKYDGKAEKKFIGLDEQLAKLRETDEHVFSDPKEIKITTKIDHSKTTTSDTVVDAARNAAGLNTVESDKGK
jgi:hypothetical protein